MYVQGLFNALAAHFAGRRRELTRFKDASFVDNAGEFVYDVLAGEILGFGKVDEGDVSALEEALDVLGVVARSFDGGFGGFEVFLINLDGTNGAQSAFIAEDEVDDFVFNELIGGMAILSADLMI